MSTSNKLVFDKFLSLINDRKISVSLSDDDMTELLANFLNASLSIYFKKCKKDLTNRVEPVDDVAGYGYFNEDLDDEEQWILAHGMIISWLSGNINTNKILADKIVSKSYHSSHSPANLLDKLNALYKASLKQIKSLTISYSFNDFTGFN